MILLLAMLADTIFWSVLHILSPNIPRLNTGNLKIKKIYHEEVKNILNENITFSATDITGECHGGDFILEGEIKKQKNIAVTAKAWQKISCSIDRALLIRH